MLLIDETKMYVYTHIYFQLKKFPSVESGGSFLCDDTPDLIADWINGGCGGAFSANKSIQDCMDEMWKCEIFTRKLTGDMHAKRLCM
jgi:hypothetical protein